MKNYIRITLSIEDKKEAENLYKSSPKHPIRQKSHSLLLSDSGLIVTKIAKILGHHEESIRKWFRLWKKDSFLSFNIGKGRGLKAKLSTKNCDTVSFIKKK